MKNYLYLTIGIGSLVLVFAGLLVFQNGKPSSDWSPSHQSARDGADTVSLIATTDDRRADISSHEEPVRTHDIAVASFEAPEQLQPGLKHHFVVSVISKHYPETVLVELYKQSPSGVESRFASRQQSISVGKPVLFDFDHLFSTNDFAAGITSIQAKATIIGYEDAVPSDNSATAAIRQVTTTLRTWAIYRGDWSIVDNQLTALNPEINGASYSIFVGSRPTTHQGDLTAEFSLLCESGLSRMSDTPVPWSIKVEGGRIRVGGDGRLLCQAQNAPYQGGSFGFWTSGRGLLHQLSDIQIGSWFEALWKK